MENNTNAIQDFAVKHFKRNFASGIVHGIFFQASDALGNIYTVLPSFVAMLTTSTMAIGLMAALLGLGGVLPQMFTAYLIEGRPKRKPYLMWVITVRWVSWAVLGGLTWWIGKDHPTLILWILIGLYSIFSLAGGMGTVVYADIFSKAIPAVRRGAFTGTRQMLGYLLAIGAGYLVKVILDAPDKFPFPQNYALIFLLSAISLLIAFTGFAQIKEPEYPSKRVSHSVRELLSSALALAKINPNFRKLLISRALTTTIMALAPFYVVYARNEIGIDPGYVGVYLSSQMAGGALSNILWGWLADRYGNRSVILGTIISWGLVMLLTLAVPLLTSQLFILVFAFLGASISGMKLGYSNIILEMADVELRPTCVALTNTLLAPVALLPLAAGALVAALPFTYLLIAGILLTVLNLVVSAGILDPRKDPTGACITEIPA